MSLHYPGLIYKDTRGRGLIFAYFNLAFICLLISFTSCRHITPNTTGAVHISYENGKYTLYKSGKPFVVKGAAGYTYLNELKQAGGNTIRTWDTAHLDKVLKDAEAHGLAVIVGLDLPGVDNGDYLYQNAANADRLIKTYTAIINKYKRSKSLLFWCVGNELEFPYILKSSSFYSVFNRLVDVIHKVDPDHPVTTTMVNINRKTIINLRLRSNIDFVSINVFGGLVYLKDQLGDVKTIWNGPYMITEWGIDGPWAFALHTPWNSYIEYNSTEKAKRYYALYHNYMPVNDPRFIGSLVFYWGNKQEYTPTWYSLFAENGAASETIANMQYIWAGTIPQHKPPQILKTFLAGKQAQDNILLKSNTDTKAEVITGITDTTGLTFSWQILPEDWYHIDNKYGIKKFKPLEHLIVEQRGSYVQFKTPAKEGPYRIYVHIYDKYNNFATSNIPFFVLADN